MKFDSFPNCMKINFDPLLIFEAIFYASQVDQSSFRMHIEHGIRSSSPTSLYQGSNPRVMGVPTILNTCLMDLEYGLVV